MKKVYFVQFLLYKCFNIYYYDIFLIGVINMNIKTSRWTLLAAILFTINAVYWVWRYSDDVVGLFVYSLAAGLFFIATVGNWKSGN